MQLRICHLYPELMNIYGDRGNVITMVKRCIWRDIAVTVTDITLGEAIDPADFDFFFIGGGQDREQILVCDDLSGDKGQAVRQAVEDGASLLAICGGYQLLGKYFLTYTGEDLPGISLFDVKTVGGDTRFIGNIAVDCEVDGIRAQLVGFENHSGRTRLGPEARPLGRVIKGYGNNGEDGTEGCVYKSAVGSYLHGSLLPKNPRLADWFILRSLRRKYELEELPGLDDALENAARDAALQFTMKEKRFRKRFGR
ncbi:MAG: glutamine amidotransferase [Candidatus Solincola sediminis]|nr:MAG: glutamine amidotransferase [Candidatus Solincola sediminis]